MPLLACVLVFAIVAGVVLVLLHPWKYNITVNGAEVTVKRNATIQDVLDAGYATPKPGNLMAVDGALCEEGQALGIPPPVYDRIVLLIKEIQEGKRKPARENLKEIL